jgi:hypothetical protein
MALEQWEIDLRRQLQDKIDKKSLKKEPWEEKLQEEIQDVPATPPHHHHHPKKNNSLVFVVLLVFLGLATLFAFDFKSGGTIRNWFMEKWSSQKCDDSKCDVPTTSPLKPWPSTLDAELARMRADIDALKTSQGKNQQDVDKLAAKVKYNSDRIALLGVVVNENFLIYRNNYDRGHLIFFNRDWTIDQMPHYIELSEQDLNYLKKFVK